MNALTEDELWADYHRDRNDAARNAIAEQYLGLVGRIVSKMKSNSPPFVDADDLTSYGSAGLMQAIKSYDPARNVRFPLWAARRIRGEILDRLRDVNPVPRSVQFRTGTVEKFSEKFRQAESRGPSQEEIYASCGERVAAAAASAKKFLSTDAVIGFDIQGDPVLAHETIADRRELDPSITATANDFINYAATHFKLTEALALKFYFYGGWTMKRIGNELINKTESRVSQLLQETVAKLREVA